MRTLEQLYTNLYIAFSKGTANSNYICNAIDAAVSRGDITQEEFYLLINNFNKNRPTPTLHPLFCNHEMYSSACWNWFGNGERAYQTRTEFLNYLIKNHIT